MGDKNYSISFMGKVTLMIAAFYTMADMFVVSPIVGNMAESMPGASGLQLNLAITLSQLTVIIGTLAVAKLVYSFSKKSLMLFGGLVVLVFGGFGGLIVDINYNLIMRAMEGFGAGMCITLIPSMIAEMFEDEKTRNSLMGIQAAVGCVFGAICSALSGTIAVQLGWQKSYFIYFFAIVIILLQVFTIPKLPAETKAINNGPKAKLSGSTWTWSLVAMLFGVLSCAVFMVIANLVIDNKVGDAAVAGLVSSAITVGSFMGSMVMTAVYSKIKNQIDTVCWLLMAIGGSLIFIACISIGSLPLLYVGAFIFGVSNGILFPWLYAKAAIIAAPNTESQTISLTNAGYYIGMFVSAFFYQLVGTIFNNNSAGFIILTMVTGCCILAAIMFILGIKNKDKKIEELDNFVS